MSNIYGKYTGLYPVSKTEKFSLIPMFETEENIKKYGILSNDENRSNEYKQVKQIFDKCHKAYLEEVLSEIVLSDPQGLFEIIENDKKNKSDEFSVCSKKMCKELSKKLKSHDLYKKLEPKAIVETVVKNEKTFCDFTEEEQASIKTFDKFSTYFQGYKENRENIYGELQGSVSYRIINENFPKFVANINLFNSLSEDIKAEAETAVKPLLGEHSLAEVFTVEFFNNVLNQSGIEFYNSLLGGVAESERKRVNGLNEFLNLKYQQHQIDKKVKFTFLFKQILSDREKASFIPQELMTDKDVIEQLFSYAEALEDIMSEAVAETEEVFFSDKVDTEKVYVDKKQLSVLLSKIKISTNVDSQLVFENDWHKFRDLLSDAGIKEGVKVYTVSQLDNLSGADVRNIVWNAFAQKKQQMKKAFKEIQPLKKYEKIEDYTAIKTYLDAVQESEKTLKIFMASDNMDKDIVFYPAFDLLYGALRSNVSVYNMVRNYATKKPYSEEKYKLNFENPSLASGWDQNKEYANNTMLFAKDSNYYLAILNAKNKPKVKESEIPFENGYSKMIYKLLPGPNKMLPKVFFSKKGLENFPVEKDILAGYEKGMHKKGDTFDLNFCHRLIDHFKDCIKKHEDWSKFNFQFSDTSTYKDIGAFYAEISAQSYKVTFSYVDEEQIRQFVKDGKMFFFQIYNKDFSEHSKGKKNLHTLYWLQLFTEENLKNPIFKLNGEAELFYRPASIDNPFVHKKGEIIANKNDKDNKPVPSEIYENIIADIYNGYSIETLRTKYPNIIFKFAKYDIVKNKRYTKPQYSFHVPITINYGCADKSYEINKMVLNDLTWNQDINIIGIDRGERNLIYVVVANQKGEILEQRSFNIIKNNVTSIDYHQKLNNLEKSRDAARKDWKQIGNIAELKEGYLSAVVKEITDLMLKYNAILVMEDLNSGFKKGRFHIEKQIYQKFEKALINKLNYLVIKDLANSEFGSTRYGYQLAPKFESFKKLGKQSGFLFYVPAAYTSKIDPVTGFVNLFTTKQLSYKSISQTRDFINSFDNICFDKEYNCFRFDFDYRNFDLYKSDFTNTWKVYSCGDNRIVHTKQNGYDKTTTINVTEKLLKLFSDNNIDITKDNLVDEITAVNNVSFYKEFLWLFHSIVQLRYEDADNDFILSPVQKNGKFFDSRTAETNMPQNGDANGAYHIALQGLRLVKTRIKDGKILKDEQGQQMFNWFKFVQERKF